MDGFWEEVSKNLFKGKLNPPRKVLGELLKRHGSEIVICHPTYRNADNIGRLLKNGIDGVLVNFRDKRVAFVVSDGTYTSADPDSSTIDAAIAGVKDGFGNGLPENVLVAVTPYEGYLQNFVPGKGSALKLVYEELAFCDAKLAIILDGDLRNDMVTWHRAFRKVSDFHFRMFPNDEMFVTARYARHFVDASLTRFVVGPLTTLMGIFVPGGISGDICLSAGAVALERGKWTEERLKYGTDISTTFDNLANPDSIIYELYLGAKLHDITDEAKLSVMPGEVIGAALERILHYRELVQENLKHEILLGHPVRWGPEQTGIEFIDPGYTNVFNVEQKVATLVKKWPEFRSDIEVILGQEKTERLAREVRLLQDAARNLQGSLRFLEFGQEKWIDALYMGLAFVLKKEEIGVVKRAFNYLYTAAFLEFCKDRLEDLGLDTFEKVVKAQDHLGVPPEKAQEFYEERVDRIAFDLAKKFFEGRKRILNYAADFS
ncbi:MAG: hypothetical protein DRG59_07445 [Deltaproteobacteria bacterium]|nr:MAG: hypothetical protein DRG59_07445 [Deltaproteobacteria bacterium]